MPRNARLVDVDRFHNIVDRALAVTERLDNEAASWVSKGSEDVEMHTGTYVYQCIYSLSSLLEFISVGSWQ